MLQELISNTQINHVLSCTDELPIGAPHVILKIYKVYPYTIYRGRPYIFLELHWGHLWNYLAYQGN